MLQMSQRPHRLCGPTRFLSSHNAYVKNGTFPLQRSALTFPRKVGTALPLKSIAKP